MDRQPNSGKGKVWAWILGVLLFIVIGGYIGWHYFKKDLANPNSKVAKPLLTDQLKKMIREASDSLYHIEYDKFNVNIDSGKGVISNFKLVPDSAVYQRLLAAHKAPNIVFYVRMDSLILNNFGFAKTKAGRRFNIAGMTIKHPVMRAVYKRQPYNDTIKKHSSLLAKLTKDLIRITSVQRMRIQDMTFTLVNRNEEHEKITPIKNLNIRIDEFNAEKLSVSNKDSSKDKDAVYFKTRLMRISTRDSLYHLDYRGVVFSPERRSMSVKQFEMLPRLSRTAFYKTVKYDKDRIHMIYNQMVMRNIDIDRLLNRQQIHIGAMIAGSSWTEVFNNYAWPKGKRPVRPHPYPHEKLQRLAFDVTIDTIRMHKSYLQYVIAANKSEKRSNFFMTNMESLYTNVTNNCQAKKQNPFAVVNIQNRMMGAGNMHVTYKFNLVSPDGAFSVTSQMGTMDAKALNPLAKPLGMMEAKAGTINKMYMHINANRVKATGNLDLYYTGLKINMLKRDDKADTLKKRGVISFLANTMLPNDNPQKNGKFRKGPINVTRDPRESFFALLWKCTLDGMSSAMMGAFQHKDKPNKNIVLKTLQSIIKPHKGETSKSKH